MNIDTIFIECLKLPVFARVEYLETEQKKSNFSKGTYLKILYDKWKEYKGIVFKKDLEIPFDELVKIKGWEYAAITVYGDEPEPFEHIYSEIEFNEIETENIFKNTNKNSFEWLNENILWLLRDYIYRLYDKWDMLPIEGSGIIKGIKPPQPIVESPFSVLEWATIFYYADETKLLTESRLLKTRLEQFMSKHQINTTFDNFKTKYYEAKKRINEKNDYPINKLELIIPFLKENYKQTVTKVENDIIFLEENKPEY